MIVLLISLGLKGGGFVIASPPNVIRITSGMGYAESVYTADRAGQWTIDGNPIPGETGATLTMTTPLEGGILRCGNSNGVRMWTPTLMATATKTGAGLWIPDVASTRAAGKILTHPEPAFYRRGRSGAG